MLILIIILALFACIQCINNNNSGTNANTKSRALMYCVGNHAVQAALLTIEPLRTIFNTSSTIVAAHCDELSESNIDILQYNNITVLNICPNNTNTILGLPSVVAKKRLRSWWCKPAAVVLAPYDEVMLVDVDAIWFKNPETLFNAKG